MHQTEYQKHLAQRGRYTDTRDLDAAGQFKPFFHGDRIKVEGPMGTRFGRVGMTTGERPAFLLMHRSTDMGSWDVLGPEDKVTAVKNGSRYIPVAEG
jgi:hypothetical protein